MGMRGALGERGLCQQTGLLWRASDWLGGPVGGSPVAIVHDSAPTSWLPILIEVDSEGGRSAVAGG